ncbi:MAG: enoyl-CoA hydratase/isomerase family protein [Lachnospiraceae bacterium]
MEYVTYSQEDQIGVLTINRPKALNALNSQVVSELTKTLEQLAQSDIRCLIITGAGDKSFVAGADIGEMKDLSSEEAAAFSREGNRMMNLVEELAVPVIAAVNGYALGGGCELALSCDIRIAAENAVFALPEVSLGIIPGYGGIQRLVRTIGLARAKELAFTTNRMKAEEAKAIGLVNQVVAQKSLMTTCMELAGKIAANAPVSVRAAKQVANQSTRLSETHELEVQAFAACFDTEDQYHAMTAFVERRKSEPFTGKVKERMI